MTVELINTGTELLLGEVTNTHLAFMGHALFAQGLRISRQVAVPDGDAIRVALKEAFSRADVILVTGGLGPTSDDLTREITAELLKVDSAHDEEVWTAIVERFARRGSVPGPNVRREAMVPETAVVLANGQGTAPGLYFPARETSPHIFLLPGPPRELKPMFTGQVLPLLQQISGIENPPTISVQRVLGIGESRVEEMVGNDLLALGLEVGYCCRVGEVDIRLIGETTIVEQGATIVRQRFGEAVHSTLDESLEQTVVSTMIEQKATLATAESCTGGNIADRLTNIPGASEMYLAGYVTYSNAAKSNSLRVPSELIQIHGAVSKPVALAMADGALHQSGADYAVATTGIAGPGGGTPEKPVGLVFVALAQKGSPTQVWEHSFPSGREAFKRQASNAALESLRRSLMARSV